MGRQPKDVNLCLNRQDNGTPPRKPKDIDIREASSVHLELIMPNLWQNYISEDVRILAAFTPVDEANTILYLRFYQRFLRLPWLGKLLAQVAMPSNVYIAHQDRRVVITQQPQASSMELGEKLVQADLPIIEYRKRRAALKSVDFRNACPSRTGIPDMRLFLND